MIMLCKDPDGSGLEDTISFCRQKNDSGGKTTYGGRAKSNINILELKQKVVSLVASETTVMETGRVLL